MPLHLKTWTRCSALFVSAALTWAPAALACAGGDSGGDGLYSATFQARAVCRPDEEALLLHYGHAFATGEGLQAPDLSKVNVDEWVAFFDGKVPAETWSKLLYKDPLSRLDALIFALQGKAGAATRPADQPFLSYGDRPTLIAALFYVGFAKRVEPWIPQLAADAWGPFKGSTATVGPEALAKLLASGVKAHAAATHPALKQRYAFQLLRLYFHHRPPAEGLRFFEEHAAEFATTSSIAYRAKGLAAGLLRKQGRVAEANVAYAELYDRFPPMKVSALQSLSWRDDAVWTATLAQAKTTRTKTVLWQALGYRADGPRAMKAIRELDPTSDLLPLLIARELNALEEEFRTDAPPPESVSKRLAALSAFVEVGSEKGNVAMPAAWDLAAGHLRAKTGDLAGALRFLERAAKRPNLSAALQQQLRASRFLAVLESKAPLKPTDDASVVRELEWLWPAGRGDERLATLGRLAQSRIAAKLVARGEPLAAACFSGDLGTMVTDASQAARFVEFIDAPPTGVLQAFALTHCARSRESIRQLQGLVALYTGDLSQAAAVLGTGQDARLLADPFVSRIKDCHDCDAADPKHKTYTRSQFVQRLAKLATEADAQPAKAAQKRFELATGLYNMTWYGNGRATYWGTLLSDGSPVTHDVKPAMAEYRKVLELTKDRELAARATFALAKCELAQFYETRPQTDERDFVAGPAFKSLASSYAGTKYYREVLQECGYFKTFVNKR
jgi:hypothetical protein